MNKMQEYFHKKETELRIDLASNREDWNFQDAFKNEIRLELLKEVSDQYGRLHNGAGLTEQLKDFRRWMIENECTKFGSDDFVVNDYLKSL